MKKISKKQNYKVFIDSVFERSQNPVEELKKIFAIHPVFFLDDNAVEYISGKLDKLNLALNVDCINEYKHMVFSCSFGSGGFGGWCSYGSTSSSPSYGPCNSGGAGWSGCSHASDGYSSSGGCSYGHGFCASTINTKYNNLILVKKDKKMSYGIIN